MSYDPATDFLALLRQSASGVEFARSPGLDIIVAALSRAGLFKLSVGQTAPGANRTVTAWLQPAQPSWTAEGTLWLWNVATAQYELATPALFANLLQAAKTPWAPYTPVLSSDGGVFTSANASGRYRLDGTTVFVEMIINVIDRGSAAFNVRASLPVLGGGKYVLAGKEFTTVGFMLVGDIDGFGSSTVGITNYDNSYPGFSGAVLVVSGTYESAS